MKSEIESLIKKEEEILKTIQDKKLIFQTQQVVEKYNLSISIIKKILGLQKSVLNENANLIEAYSTVRYILETLIQTELLLKESSYTFKLYYSIYSHQIDKYQKYINRIKQEIEIMKVYELKDELLSDKMAKDISLNKDSSIAMDEYHFAQKELDDKADLEFTMFTPDYKINGYGFTKHLLETKILPEYEKRFKEIQDSTEQIAKAIVKQERISKLFDFKNQFSRVFKELKDVRSWQKKAEETNLCKEYELVYDLSSAVLHSTSYSFNTIDEYTDSDKDIALKLIYKYSKKINKNIKDYLNIDMYSKFAMINIEE
jgi:hypothetical protein